jgi:hypothetical protein
MGKNWNYYKVRNEIRVSTLSTLFQHSPGIPTQSNETGTRIWNRKWRLKLSLFASDVILYLKNKENYTKKLLGIINTQQSSRIKISLPKEGTLLYTNDKQSEKKYKKTIPFTIASKIKIPEDKLNKVSQRSPQWKL